MLTFRLVNGASPAVASQRMYLVTTVTVVKQKGVSHALVVPLMGNVARKGAFAGKFFARGTCCRHGCVADDQ